MNFLYRLPHILRRHIVARRVTPFTLVSQARIQNLYRLARRIEAEAIPGDVIECGVCNGGTAAILAHFATRSPQARLVWLFDSFAGMPETTALDGPAAPAHIGQEVGTIENVERALALVGADQERVRIMPGWFQDTFPRVSIQKIALLNIDADWYESVKLCLETFYERVVPGGFVSIDDYGYWPGCKVAVDEFLAARQTRITLHRADYTAHWFKKP